MLSKKQEKIIKIIVDTLNLGSVLSITYVKSSQNLVYLVETDKKSYYIKQYSKDAIRNNKDLVNRKRQVAVAESLKENGVPAVLPLTFDNKYFIKYNKDYFLVFDYLNKQPITEQDLNIKRIKKLANTLAIIHKLDIKCSLNCQYKKVNIDFNKYLKKYNKLDKDLYDIVKDNQLLLEELISSCNNNISKVKDHLCVSHNDYKLLNILWEKDYMYLIDFDATAMSNPTVSFAEAAFALSRQNNELNKEFYKEFVSSYVKKYGVLDIAFEDALSVSMNGKLQWLEYLMSNCSKRNRDSIDGVISMVKELRLFIDSKEEMIGLYNSVLTNKKEKKKKRTKK